MKQCRTCKKRKSLDDFHKSSQTKDGRSPYCKPCRSKYETGRRRRDREEINRRRREALAADPRETRIRRRMTVYKLTREQSEDVETKTTCDWCTRKLSDKRGPDSKNVHHCHNSGDYVATLCGMCNTMEGWITRVDKLPDMSTEKYLDILRAHLLGTSS